MKYEIGFKSGNKITFDNEVSTFKEVVQHFFGESQKGVRNFNFNKDFLVCIDDIEYLRVVEQNEYI